MESTENWPNAGTTNKARYGPDYYRRIGAMGGKVSRGGGFTGNPELAREAGKKGGAASRRSANQVKAE